MRPTQGIRWWGGALVAASLLVGLPAAVIGHPHIWVTYAVVVPLGPHGLEAVRFVWTFDEQFSSMILGAFGPEAPPAEHLRVLRAIPYIIEVSYNGTAVELGEPAELTASVADRQVTYRFAIPVRTPVRKPGMVDVHVDDPGLFTAFTFRSPPATEVDPSGPLTAECDRPLLSSGAPGPIRCTLHAVR